MKKFAFIFPGQGSQKLNMGVDFVENFNVAKDIFEQASDIVNIDISSIVKNEEALKDPVNTQVALFTVSTAILAVLKKENPKIINDFCLGHSLGEYTALVASGVLKIDDALKLIKNRATFMKECVENIKGSMCAIIGVDRVVVEKLVEKSKQEGEILVCANYNSNIQTVVSGEVDVVNRLIENAKEQGIKKAVLLPVAGAFHSPLMNLANDKLKKYITETKFNTPSKKFISSQNGKIIDNPDIIKSNLENQIISQVDWVAAVNTAVKMGTTDFIEVGSGQVLCGLVSKIHDSVKTKAINDISSLEEVVKFY